ncbi:MAG: NAD(P)-dependent oxidoreductase [bacterium]|nr:NAD(P)-dependent oxidoreductase [bacterium]
MLPTISILGLGLMGRPMARRLIAKGFDVRGWNRSRLPEDLTAGITQCPDLQDAAAAEVLLFMLEDSSATDAVLDRLEPYLRPPHLVLDMGSSDPARSRAHAAKLAARGIGWVDAPVSGGPEGAANGILSVMVGGTEADVSRARPLLEAVGGNIVHVGPPGAGHTTKVINQIIVGLAIEAVAEALTLAEKCGLDPCAVQQALRGGYADSRVLQIHGTRMVNRAYTPGGKARTHLKDLRLAQSLASSVGVRLPHLESVATLFQTLVDQGGGDLDHSALHRLLWTP